MDETCTLRNIVCSTILHISNFSKTHPGTTESQFAKGPLITASCRDSCVRILRDIFVESRTYSPGVLIIAELY